MIPLPPPDPTLGDMHLALDGDAMAEVLSRHMVNLAPGATVQTCKPSYVKYKPDKYRHVQYELVLDRGARVRPERRLAHVSWFPAKRAEKLLIRHRLAKGGETSEARTGAAYIDELGGIAQLFPVDLSLPGLVEAASPEEMRRRLADVLPSGGELRRCDVELVRYKASKRAVLRYQLQGGRAGAVYGKLRKDYGLELLQVTGSLRRAGVSTPAMLAHLPELGMVVQSEAEGTRLGDLRGSPSYVQWMRPVAEVLAHLHESRIECLRPHGTADELHELEEAARVVGRLRPHLATEAKQLVARLRGILAGIRAESSTIHGSFHDDQVLVSKNGAVIVDLDSAGLGHPLSDVGHFLSYLSAGGANAARTEFLDAYLTVRPSASDDYLAFEAAALLRWATLPFRELQPDWPKAVEDRLHGATDRLDDYRR